MAQLSVSGVAGILANSLGQPVSDFDVLRAVVLNEDMCRHVRDGDEDYIINHTSAIANTVAGLHTNTAAAAVETPVVSAGSDADFEAVVSDLSLMVASVTGAKVKSVVMADPALKEGYENATDKVMYLRHNIPEIAMKLMF